MKIKALTLTELLVGVTVSMLLIMAMGRFLGEVAYRFQEQKTIYNTRSGLLRSMSIISRDLRSSQLGTKNGKIRIGTVDSSVEYPGLSYVLDNTKPADLQTVLTFYISEDSMDDLASSENLQFVGGSGIPIANAEKIVYQVTQHTDPVDPSGDLINVLERNGSPVVLYVKEWLIEVGDDFNGDGALSDGEWERDNSSSEETDGPFVRVTLSIETEDTEGKKLVTRQSTILDVKNYWEGRGAE